MLFPSERHEPLHEVAWDEDRARAASVAIAADAERQFDPEALWPMHPLDREPSLPMETYKGLYIGAAGVIWALDYLARAGAVDQERDYAPLIDAILAANRRDFQAFMPDCPSYLLGDVGILLVGWRIDPTAARTDQLAERIESNLAHPSNELMVGTPGTTLAALFLFEATRQSRWRELFLRGVEQIWGTWSYSPDDRCHLWTQDFMNRQSRMLGAVHGFTSAVQPLLSGAIHLDAERRTELHRRCAETLERTAVREDHRANWPQNIGQHRAGRTQPLVQYCHGAPGMITPLAALPADPGSPIEQLLCDGGELIWRAGPLTKGPNLCHGTAGNGQALLELYRRTRRPIWLQRARAFAMHAIDQCERARSEHGQGRYSLWTGDLGVAVYLWHCIQAAGEFPTVGVF